MIEPFQIFMGFVGGAAVVGGISYTLRTKIIPPVSVSIATESNNDTEIALARAEARQQGFDEGRKDAQTQAKEILDAKLEAEAERSRREGYEKGLVEGRSSYKIDIQPFYRKKQAKMSGWKTFNYTYGFNYQLFVNGIPSMEPFERTLDSEKAKELDADEIEKRVRSLIHNAVSGMLDAVPGVATVSKLIEKQ